MDAATTPPTAPAMESTAPIETRMYVVVRGDLPVGYQIAQSAHAVAELVGRTGQVNELTVYELEARRKSNVEVSQLIKGTYSNLPYSSGIQIMEVTPRDDRWVGTIGQQLVATYRFEIDADGESCLYDYRSGRQVRCSQEAEAEPGSEEAPGLLTDEQLNQLSADELRDLRAQVDDEFDRRLDEAGQQPAEGGEG